MKSFLENVAEATYGEHPDPRDVVIVVPNRRAALYLQKHLAEKITRPVFAPGLLTIEDFIAGFSEVAVADKLQLIHILYQTYQNIIANNAEPEPFDQFYFWGEMLLRDFDEADKYLVNADHLFRDLSHQKELDVSFDYLTTEQKAFLKTFWSSFDENLSENKKRFLSVWKQLPEVYHAFRQKLLGQKLAYQGMLHRMVAENIHEHKARFGDKKICFAGFNAFTAAEEKIIAWFIENSEAKMSWDVDQYYVNNRIQEAGRFFRSYQDHPVFGKTFPHDVPANFLRTSDGARKSIHLYGAAQPIGQAKLLSQIVAQHLSVMNPEETVIVLPDEKLLPAVLHGVSEAVEKLNVTMGFPLSSTPFFNLVELLTELQLSKKDGGFNHRQVLAVLAHPYVVASDPVASSAKRKEILRHNWVHIPSSFLATTQTLHRIIFNDMSEDSSAEFIAYLSAVVHEIGNLRAIGDVDKEYAYHFIQLLNKLAGILGSDIQAKRGRKEKAKALRAFLRLFRQLVRSEKIPFAGEPLKGLQIMGVLETRNLDFKNVFVLSLNEGSFPANANRGSYIPFNIRKAYNLPTPDHQDAIYAYLFYRLLQRADNIFLFYNSETDVLGQGEMSRYLQQLVYESGLEVHKKILDNPIRPQSITPITVEKDADTLAELVKINEGNKHFTGISPSALNMYLECRLKFYFRHIAKIREPNEVEEELDARVLGNFLHDVMEGFYRGILERKNDNTIEASDLENHEPVMDKLIDEVFIKTYNLEPGKKVTYEGQRLVVREVVKRFTNRIIAIDKSYCPFRIEALEKGGINFDVAIDHAPYRAVIGGKIDRVDSKENVMRIIDYKTGKDRMSFDSIASLFARDGDRNKAAFQTLLYALLYTKTTSAGNARGMTVLPGLINRMNLFDDAFSFGLKLGKDTINDATHVLPEFQAHLTALLNELFDPAVPFDQTTDTLNCRLCAYSQLCYR